MDFETAGIDQSSLKLTLQESVGIFRRNSSGSKCHLKTPHSRNPSSPIKGTNAHPSSLI